MSKPGSNPVSADIQTSLLLRTAFKLPLRQTEDLMTSVLSLMGLTISAPARGFAAQQSEAATGVAVLNRMPAAGRPDSVRHQPGIA
jgi:hypothetical protein